MFSIGVGYRLALCLAICQYQDWKTIACEKKYTCEFTTNLFVTLQKNINK